MDSWNGRLARLAASDPDVEHQLYFGTSVWSVADAGVTQTMYSPSPKVTQWALCDPRKEETPSTAQLLCQ